MIFRHSKWEIRGLQCGALFDEGREYTGGSHSYTSRHTQPATQAAAVYNVEKKSLQEQQRKCRRGKKLKCIIWSQPPWLTVRLFYHTLKGLCVCVCVCVCV